VALLISGAAGVMLVGLGRVRWVQLDIDEAAEDLDHMVSPEERYKIAMTRQ
jgi:hypothetical protein